MKEKKFEQLESWEKDLIFKSEKVMRRAYNLYSHFCVGATVLTDSGKTYTATFAENSSQGGTICAERAAILAANTDGERYYKAIAVIGAGESFDCQEPVTPCGMCRQFISDFAQIADHDIKIICSNTKKDRIYITSIRELLPVAFGPKDTGQDISRFRK
jgi:cytidine deaminase